MIITYKDFEIKKDDFCYNITKKVKYEKRESLHGPLTGEIGEKEEIIGYYTNLTLMINKLAEVSVEETEVIELKDYVKQILNNQKEIKKMFE
jgi:hypothetical protein